MAHLYILKSSSRKFYVGSTEDLEKRIAHHRGGHTPSTKRLGEVELVFSQEYSSLREARKIESWLKRMKRRDYLEQIIKDGYIKHMLR